MDERTRDGRGIDELRRLRSPQFRSPCLSYAGGDTIIRPWVSINLNRGYYSLIVRNFRKIQLENT